MEASEDGGISVTRTLPKNAHKPKDYRVKVNKNGKNFRRTAVRLGKEVEGVRPDLKVQALLVTGARILLWPGGDGHVMQFTRLSDDPAESLWLSSECMQQAVLWHMLVQMRACVLCAAESGDGAGKCHPQVPSDSGSVQNTVTWEFTRMRSSLK